MCQPLPCCRGRARGACPSPAFCSLWEGLGAHPRWWLLSGCSAGWLGNSGRLVGAARRPPHWAVPEASTRGRGCTSQGLGLSRVEEPAWAPGPAWVKDRPRLTSKTQPLEQSQPGSQSGRSVALARSPNGPVPQSPPPLVLGLSSVQDGSYCPVFQTGKLRLRTLTGCRKVTPLVQQAVGSEPGLLGPQRPLENLGGRGRGPWGRGGRGSAVHGTGSIARHLFFQSHRFLWSVCHACALHTLKPTRQLHSPPLPQHRGPGPCVSAARTHSPRCRGPSPGSLRVLPWL